MRRSEEQDADRSGQDARKHHFHPRKRPGESNDRLGLKKRLVVFADSVGRLEKLFARYSDELQQDSYYVLLLCEETSLSKSQIFTKLGKSPQSKNVKMYIQPLIDRKLLVPTIKGKPTSPYQKYKTTSLGMKFLYYVKQRWGDG